MNTADENLQQAAHEKMMRTDPEYALKHHSENIYQDLANFKDFVDGNEAFYLIAAELLRALCQIENANRATVDLDNPGLGLSDQETMAVVKRNISIKRSRHAVMEAVTRMKIAMDAKIEHCFEGVTA